MLAAVLALVPAAFLGLLVMAAIYILAFGDRAERAGIVAIVIGSLATGLAANDGPAWYHAETGIFIVDVATLIAFIAIMGSSRRFWPLWITAFQIVAVMTHLARFVKPETVPIAYAIAEQLWAYLMLAILTACVRLQRSRSWFAISKAS